MTITTDHRRRYRSYVLTYDTEDGELVGDIDITAWGESEVICRVSSFEDAERIIDDWHNAR